MKIVFAGGGTGGHFYPLIAVAESMVEITDREKLANLQMYYFGTDPYDAELLHQYGIEYRHVNAGKLRMYFSLDTIPDLIKTAVGVFQAMIEMFSVYPDVVFSKGGYGAFPVLVAAWIFRIPVVIHDSDSVPGRVSVWSGKFAKRIALVYSEAAKYFKSGTVAITGLPIRKAILHPQKEGAHEYLLLDSSLKTLVVLGGSQGAEAINDALLNAAPELVKNYQVIHQVGEKNLDSVTKEIRARLTGTELENRYKVFGTLSPLAMSMAAGIAALVITRAGSTLCEIAAWGVPSIVVPIPKSVSRDQSSNAFCYAQTGAAIVIEQQNLTPHLLVNEVGRLLRNHDEYAAMVRAAKGFARIDAADLIAKELIIIAKEHEIDA